MADLTAPALHWTDDCVDPGVREASLPDPAPQIGDDFDWRQRDYESFRQAIWTELQERFPERDRWTSGDVEAVLTDVLASHLDQLSDMADRVSAEAYLVSARRVESLLSWLSFIGYKPWQERGITIDELKTLYRAEPHQMELDRRRGPTSIRRQQRMVSAVDYGQRLEQHPLVLRAYTKQEWNGAWLELTAHVALINDRRLDDELGTEGIPLSERHKQEITLFHSRRDLRGPQWQSNPTIRELLGDYIRKFRMVGQPVSLRNVVPVGVIIDVCVSVKDSYFRSEIRREVARALGWGPDGFFRPGHLAAGQDVRLGDIYEWVMSVSGVDSMTLRRFGKLRDDPRIGDIPNAISMGPTEIAVCTSGGRGIVAIELRGGRSG